MPTTSPNGQLPLPRLTAGGLARLGGGYLVFAVGYASTIAYVAHAYQPHAWPQYLGQVVGVDYPLKALWTLPVWWLFFRGPLRQLPGPLRLWAHLLTGPLWVGAWFASYYALLPLLGRQGLSGNGRAWDVYIPLLFYGVQFGALHGVEFARQLRWQNQRARLLREQAHASTLSALKAQINPHFLFNTLNSISASVPPELEGTRELIARLAHTFRFALQASQQELVPLGEEIRFLQAYLHLEETRFGARLTSCFVVAPALLPRLVPPMLLQPLVENAVRYGIAPSVAGGTVRVEIAAAESGGGLHVCLTNTGQGWPPGRPLHPDQPDGIGLRTTHARLVALGSPGLVLESPAAGGLRVCFYLPAPMK